MNHFSLVLSTLAIMAVPCLLPTPCLAQHIYAEENPQPTVEKGAVVFVEYCSLCHGTQGMGDGNLATRIKDYPSTSLLKPKYAHTKETLLEAIVYGGVLPELSVYMPPFGKELSWTQTQSVTEFITTLRANRMLALQKLDDVKEASAASFRVGKKIYDHRCTLCHGQYGEGDGRMAKVIKNPPPADLTKSQLAGDYLIKIIADGGESVARSPQMPPWKDELSTSEIESVILYIKTLRLSP